MGILAATVWKIGRIGFPFALLFALAVLGAVRLRPRLSTPLYLFVGLYGLSVAAVFVTARYRIPMIPALAVFAALGAQTFADAVRRRSRTNLAICSALFFTAFTLSAAPPPFCEEEIDLEPELYFVAANARIKSRDTDGALQFYQKAAALNPDYFEAYLMLGLTLYNQHRTPEAVDALTEAVRIRPESMKARLELGRVAISTQRYGTAIDALSPAVDADPRHPRSRYLLGTALFHSGKPQEALSHLQAAARLAPDNVAVRRQLSTVKAQLQALK